MSLQVFFLYPLNKLSCNFCMYNHCFEVFVGEIQHLGHSDCFFPEYGSPFLPCITHNFGLKSGQFRLYCSSYWFWCIFLFFKKTWLDLNWGICLPPGRLCCFPILIFLSHSGFPEAAPAQLKGQQRLCSVNTSGPRGFHPSPMDVCVDWEMLKGQSHVSWGISSHRLPRVFSACESGLCISRGPSTAFSVLGSLH